jgi:prevent-host-death family protein
MAVYSIAEAKNRLPKLINKALEGEEVVISRRGKPLVEIRPTVARPAEQRERIREMDEWLLRRTRSRPSIGLTSLEILDLLYEHPEE